MFSQENFAILLKLTLSPTKFNSKIVLKGNIMIETPDANLSIGMRHLNGVYTQK